MLFDLEWDVLKATKKMSSKQHSLQIIKNAKSFISNYFKKYIYKKRHRVPIKIELKIF